MLLHVTNSGDSPEQEISTNIMPCQGGCYSVVAMASNDLGRDHGIPDDILDGIFAESETQDWAAMEGLSEKNCIFKNLISMNENTFKAKICSKKYVFQSTFPKKLSLANF